MTKRITSFVLGLLMAVTMLCVPSFAENEKFHYEVDEAGLLTEEEHQQLEDNGAVMAEDYDFGVYIITVDDITDYVDATDMESAAEELYLSYELGESDDQSGLLLLLSMDTREWAMFAFGYGNVAFTDYGKQYLSGSFKDDFGKNNWYSGLENYQKVSGEMLTSAMEGDPIDTDNIPHARVFGVIACIILGFVIAFIVRGALKGQLKSVAAGTDAEKFVADGGLKLHEQYDHFTHRTESRVYNPPDDDSKSGGTTTRSSGGSSASGSF